MVKLKKNLLRKKLKLTSSLKKKKKENRRWAFLKFGNHLIVLEIFPPHEMIKYKIKYIPYFPDSFQQHYLLAAAYVAVAYMPNSPRCIRD